MQGGSHGGSVIIFFWIYAGQVGVQWPELWEGCDHSEAWGQVCTPRTLLSFLLEIVSLMELVWMVVMFTKYQYTISELPQNKYIFWDKNKKILINYFSSSPESYFRVKIYKQCILYIYVPKLHNKLYNNSREWIWNANKCCQFIYSKTLFQEKCIDGCTFCKNCLYIFTPK